MAYKLSISKRAQEQLDECLYYLMFRLKNSTAAEHLLSCIESVYERLECKDAYLKSLHYREVVLTQMSYIMIVKITEETVYIIGIFHQLEDYGNKLL